MSCLLPLQVSQNNKATPVKEWLCTMFYLFQLPAACSRLNGDFD